MTTTEDRESGQEVAKHEERTTTASRHHVDYWKERLYRKTFTRDGARHEIAEYSVRLQHLGRREAFSLASSNAGVAASKAKEIATFLEANGWEPTLAKHKPGVVAKLEVCTLGQLIKDLQTRSHLQPRTLRIYTTKLRKLVSDVARLEVHVGKKARRAKFDYVNGGRAAWLAKVDGQRLDVLTPEAINKWRGSYVAKAGADPLARKSAERSAASMLRAGRRLFSAELVAMLNVKVPPSPFVGVKVKEPGPRRYHSTVSPEWLLACAGSELRAAQPQLYLALFLCLWAGLRRKEADLLMWAQIDLEEGNIHVRRTENFEPKTEESQRTIDLAPAAVDVLRSFKQGAIGEFVLVGEAPNPSASYGYYRCDCTWRDLIAWLKKKGVTQRNAVHALRKESGSLIASSHGIEAARQHLGHRDIRTTSSHYVDKKRRVEVSLPMGAAGKLQAVGE